MFVKKNDAVHKTFFAYVKVLFLILIGS